MNTGISSAGRGAACVRACDRHDRSAQGSGRRRCTAPVAAVTLPGDRRDDLVTATAAAVAAWFGRVVVYEDSDLRGRRPGEMTELISAALTARRPGITIEAANGPAAALR